jgi:hypothetical protein
MASKNFEKSSLGYWPTFQTRKNYYGKRKKWRK